MGGIDHAWCILGSVSKSPSLSTSPPFAEPPQATAAAHAGRARWVLVVAAIAVLCAAAWLGLNVALNYGGQLTGLFYTGSKTALPAELGAGHTRRVADEAGYDAQFYHIIAHDPLIRREFVSYVDNPQLRWRRIGVPGLAALLTAGSHSQVDSAYVAIQLVFVFLGAFWLSRYAQRQGEHPGWGLAFLVIPAVAVSLDRMTIDLPLAALSIGFALYATDTTGPGQGAMSPRWPVYVILSAAPLVRETGMVLVLAWCAYSALRRDWRAAGMGAGCALPTLAWWAYVHSRTPVDHTLWLSAYPFSGIIERTIRGVNAPVSTLWLHSAAILEQVALIGIWLALLLAFYLAWRRRCGVIELTAILFAAFAAAVGRFDVWSSAYATGRTMSPLLIMLALLALRERRFAFALPLLLVLPRVGLQYEAQLRLALRSVF